MKIWLLAAIAFSQSILAADFTTNAVRVENAPSWVTTAVVNRVSDRVERALEWDIRRVRVRWFENDGDFAKAHGLTGDPTTNVLAVTKKNRGEILIGPRVTKEKFEGVLGHELAHVIIFQKYKQAIPVWLEEGLANYVSGRKDVNYAELRTFLNNHADFDVRTLGHPFRSQAKGLTVSLQYMLSTALMQAIAANCRVYDLLQMSVGYSVDTYLKNLCGISDLNATLRRHVSKRR